MGRHVFSAAAGYRNGDLRGLHVGNNLLRRPRDGSIDSKIHQQSTHFLRFIDDMFGIWLDDGNTTTGPAFKWDADDFRILTWEFKELLTSVDYLDLTISIEVSSLTTKTYKKIDESVPVHFPAICTLSWHDQGHHLRANAELISAKTLCRRTPTRWRRNSSHNLLREARIGSQSRAISCSQATSCDTAYSLPPPRAHFHQTSVLYLSRIPPQRHPLQGSLRTISAPLQANFQGQARG
ncbi:hypothetical protein ACHAWF_001789 [Thalassiosira exigua]